MGPPEVLMRFFREAGFGQAVMLTDFHFDRTLLSAFLEKLHPEMHSFHTLELFVGHDKLGEGIHLTGWTISTKVDCSQRETRMILRRKGCSTNSRRYGTLQPYLHRLIHHSLRPHRSSRLTRRRRPPLWRKPRRLRSCGSSSHRQGWKMSGMSRLPVPQLPSRRGSGSVGTKHMGQAELVRLICQLGTITCLHSQACTILDHLSSICHSISPSTNTTHILLTIRLVRAIHYNIPLTTSTTHLPRVAPLFTIATTILLLSTSSDAALLFPITQHF
ncbi:hypothetical protein PIB30_093769 [Stylosanthes scabra]|uniref:Uncharacterized protein n=1 Tax=Stylosanthes scabra TaxID=79078 RepID=A0ABU6UUK3_9FABA|nr:hypothetical protein [Stylosanthes scabra]